MRLGLVIEDERRIFGGCDDLDSALVGVDAAKIDTTLEAIAGVLRWSESVSSF